MAGNLSWEAKVDSILRQTGDDLERLKVQLHGQSEQSAWMQSPLRGAEQAAVGLPVYPASVALPFGEGYNAAEQQLVAQQALLRNSAAIPRDEQRKSAPTYSPLVLHGVTERLNQQEMEIASLRSALATMEERNKEHERLIQQLKVESSELRSHLAGQGVHVTEGKFEQWKAQMMAKVQSLHSAVSAHHSVQRGRSEDREGVAQLAHELQKAKISTSGDIHWLNQELRALKTQLGRLELRVASLQCSIGQLQSDAEDCRSHRAKQQPEHSQHIAQIRRDLKSLERRAARCEHEMPLQDRPRHNTGQTASSRSGSGDSGGRKEQEEGLGEGQSFTSEGSSREGETMAEDVSALSIGSLREESPTELLSSDLSTPTLQLSSSSDC